MSPSTLLDQRSALTALVEGIARDFDAILPDIPSDPAAALDMLLEVAPALVEAYISAAGMLAADWYDELRALVDTTSTHVAVPADLPGADERLAANVRWAIGPMFAGAAVGLVAYRLLGSSQRAIMDGHRVTIAEATVSDPAARGWARFGSGSSCPFCQMLIDRGGVYSTSGAQFASHDDCNCMAGPSFEGGRHVGRYVPTTRRIEPATRVKNNARVRAWVDGQ